MTKFCPICYHDNDEIEICDYCVKALEMGCIENTTEALDVERERLAQEFDKLNNSNFFSLDPKLSELDIQLIDVTLEIAHRQAADDNLIENTTEALECEELRLGKEVYRSDYLPIIQNQYIDVVEEVIRRKYPVIPEYDTHNSFCDDCGRKNCICDGGYSVWMNDACVTCGQEHSTHLRSNDKYYCGMCWTIWNS